MTSRDNDFATLVVPSGSLLRSRDDKARGRRRRRRRRRRKNNDDGTGRRRDASTWNHHVDEDDFDEHPKRILRGGDTTQFCYKMFFFFSRYKLDTEIYVTTQESKKTLRESLCVRFWCSVEKGDFGAFVLSLSLSLSCSKWWSLWLCTQTHGKGCA